MWRKLYRRELFSEITPSRMKMGEDLIVNMKMFPSLKKYVQINNVVYNYRYGGMTSNYNPYLFPDLKKQYYIKKETIAKYDYTIALNSAKIEMCNVIYSNIVQMLRFGKPIQDIENFIEKEIANDFVSEITEKIEYSRPYFKYLKNKDIQGLLHICRKEVTLPKRIIRNITNRILSFLQYI